MVKNLITRTFPIPHDMVCTKRRGKIPHALLLHRMKKRITSVNIKNMSRLRDNQNEHPIHSSNVLKQNLCSNRWNAPISQEIVLEIAGLASAFVHLDNEISEWMFREWVNKRVIVYNFSKSTPFNAFLDDKLKVVFVRFGCSRNPTDATWTSFWYAMIRTKWRCWILLVL